MGIVWKEIDGYIVSRSRDPLLENNLKLKDEELKIIKRTCHYKGIENRIVNPKSISLKNLMGNFEETSREWTDGVLTHQIRIASLDNTEKK